MSEQSAADLSAVAEAKTAPDKPPLPDPKPKPQAVAEVVAHLADLLHRATQGEIVAIAIAGVRRDRVPVIGWAAQSNDTTNDLTAAVSDLAFAISDLRAERSYTALRPAQGQPAKEAQNGQADAAGTPG
jgi:hypothetical protein